MSAALIASIYNGAAGIAKPLSLSALLATFLTLIVRQSISALREPLAKATSDQAVSIIASSLRYIFILSLIALIGGLGSYAVEFILQDYVKKYAWEDKARSAINTKDPDQIIRYSSKLIYNYPSYYEGYHFRGVGEFYKTDYSDALRDFAKAQALLPYSPNNCEDLHRDFISNVATAQISTGNYPEALATMRTIEPCGLEKHDLYNLSEVLIMNGIFEEAEKILTSDKLYTNAMPDYRALAHMELGILSFVRKEDRWLAKAKLQFEQAMNLDQNLRPLLICGVSTYNASAPGQVNDFRYEISILARADNKNYTKSIRSELATGSCAS